jgi:hypothetical protein
MRIVLIISVFALNARCSIAFSFHSPNSNLKSNHVGSTRRISAQRAAFSQLRGSTLPEWDILEKTKDYAATREILGSNLSGRDEVPSGRMVLFRDRNGWCPYSERVWLAMTVKGLDFDEILINLQGGKPMWYSEVVPTGNTPAIRDKSGEVVHDSLRILRYLEERYPDRPLLPTDPTQRALADDLLDAFARTMPQGARPSSRGAYLYRGSGLPLPQAEPLVCSVDSISIVPSTCSSHILRHVR